MTIALEIAAGMVLTTALVTGMTILAALELGRMVTKDDEPARGGGEAATAGTIDVSLFAMEPETP